MKYIPTKFVEWLREDIENAIIGIEFWSSELGDYQEEEGETSIVAFRCDLIESEKEEELEVEEGCSKTFGKTLSLKAVAFDSHSVCMEVRTFDIPLDAVYELTVNHLVPHKCGYELEPYAIWRHKPDSTLFRFACQ